MIDLQCELCGRIDRLVKARIEGAELDVCTACASFGKVLTPPNQQKPRRDSFSQPKQQPLAAKLPTIVEDFAVRIRKAREKFGITQEEFAKKISEKHSLVQKIEGGTLTPPLALAKKLERILHITLVEETKETESFKDTNQKNSNFTLGDFITLKKK